MFFEFIFLLLLSSKGIHSAGDGDGNIVCYLDERSLTKTGSDRFTLDLVDPHGCTHIIYSWATVQEGKGVVPLFHNLDIDSGGYFKVTDLKKKNPDLKVLLSIGSDEHKTSAIMSKMLSDPDGRALIIETTTALLMKYSFDGVDIAWQYPGQAEYGSSSERNKDKVSLSALIQEMKQKFKNTTEKSLILSLLLPSQTNFILNGYEILKLNKEVDLYNIITYDIVRNNSDPIHHSAIYLPPEKNKGPYFSNSADVVIKTYARVGIDLFKVNMGIPTFGRLISPAKKDESGNENPKEVYTEGEICELMKDNQWQTIRDPSGPILVKGDMKISYEDEESVKDKAKFAKKFTLAGVMFSTLDKMDYKKVCENGPYAMIKSVKEAFTSF